MSIRFSCPECNAEIKVSERHAGQKGRCASCNARILVPTLEEAAELKAKEAKKKAAPPAAPTAIPSSKPVSRPTPVTSNDPEHVRPTRPEPVQSQPVEKSREPVQREEPPPLRPVIATAAVPAALPESPEPPAIPEPPSPPQAAAPADIVSENAETEQLSLPNDFFDDFEVPETVQPAAQVVEPIAESPAEEVFSEPVAQEEAEKAYEEYEEFDEEDAYSDRELIAAPSAALSTAEGNDILSAVALDPHDLIHLEGDDHEHPAPLMNKSVGLEGVEELVDMTAMVDIVFFLLIFFMMTTMQNVSASIETPGPDPDKLAAKGQSVSAMEDDSSAVKIRIAADNSIQFDGERVGGEQELRSRLSAAFPGGGSSKKLFVMGHGDAFHGTVVMVLDAAHSNGIQDIRLAVVDEEP